jgi:hypothetical protein
MQNKKTLMFFILLLLGNSSLSNILLHQILPFKDRNLSYNMTFQEIASNFEEYPDQFTIISKLIIQTDPNIGNYLFQKSFMDLGSLGNLYRFVYYRTVTSDQGTFIIYGQNMGKITSFYENEQGRRVESVYISFDFHNKKLNVNGNTTYDLVLKTHLDDPTVNGPLSNFRKYTFGTFTDVEMKNFSIKFITFKIEKKFLNMMFHQTILAIGKQADDIISGDFGPVQELIYQLVFYEEPTESNFLYNRSSYVFSPAFNGDPSTGSGRLKSFFCNDLGRTFWIGLASGKPNYLMLPDNLFYLFNFDVFEMVLVLDVLLLDDGTLTTGNGDSGYTLFSVEDVNQISIIEVKHRIDSADFTSNVSYFFFIDVYVQGVLTQSKRFLSDSFYHLKRNLLRFRMNKNMGNVITSVFFENLTQGVTQIGENITIPVNMSDWRRLYIGHKDAPFSFDNIAYVFSSMHVFGDKYPFIDNGVYNAFSKNTLTPTFSTEEDYWIWTPPQDPKAKEVYTKKLEESGLKYILFQSGARPDNCETFFNELSCLVCRVGYVLDEHSKCRKVDESSSSSAYLRSARQMILDGVSFFENFDNDLSKSQINTGYFLFELFYQPRTSTNNNGPMCQWKNTQNEVFDHHVDWDFESTPPNSKPQLFKEFQKSFSNNSHQILQRAGPISISTNTCQMTSSSVTHIIPNCDKLKLQKSLKGGITMSFCDNLFFDIVNNKHMLYATTQMPTNKYYYQLPIPGTTNILYGECQNNCNCWDGNLLTSKGYNSCFLDPQTNQICKSGYFLKTISIDPLLQECAQTPVSCHPSCKTCDSYYACTSCQNPAHEINFTSPFSGSLFCRDCAPKCLTCSSFYNDTCLCFEDQFGEYATATFDADFRLCQSSLICPRNCLKCRNNTSCDECKPFHEFDKKKNACVIIDKNECLISQENSTQTCLECPLTTFKDARNRCIRCPANCLHCENSKCLVCKKGFRLYNNFCVNFSPFLPNLISNIFPVLGNQELPQLYRLLQYDITSFFYPKTDSIYDYDYIKITNKKDFEFESQKKLNEYFREFKKESCVIDEKSFNCLFLKKFGYNVTQVKQLNQQSLLSEMTPNCEEAKRKFICSKCKKGFALETSSGKCLPNQDKFSAKEKLNKIKQKYIPIKCGANHYLNNKTSTCQKRVKDCMRMDNSGRCIECFPYFVLSQDHRQCFQCSENCVKCDSPDNCIRCSTGYSLHKSQGKILH